MKLSAQARRVILLTALLVICLALLLVVTRRAARAYLEVRHLRTVAAGEAVDVRPWMTIPYIAHVYHVPEEELWRALDLTPTKQERRDPLHVIARHHHRDVHADILTLEARVEALRAPTAPRPPPAPTPPPRP